MVAESGERTSAMEVEAITWRVPHVAEDAPNAGPPASKFSEYNCMNACKWIGEEAGRVDGRPVNLPDSSEP